MKASVRSGQHPLQKLRNRDEEREEDFSTELSKNLLLTQEKCF